MNAPKWKQVSVKSVKFADYNPKGRTEDAAAAEKSWAAGRAARAS